MLVCHTPPAALAVGVLGGFVLPVETAVRCCTLGQIHLPVANVTT
jgi:hypothetical protein